MTALICQNKQRREAVRQHRQLNGLDYIEVGVTEKLETTLESQRILTVYFLGKAPVELDASNVLIEGGRRITDIQVEKVKMHRHDQSELDDSMEVVVDRAGDFSTYTLRVVEKSELDKEGKWEWIPHRSFDSRYDRINFTFKADCPSDLDCKQNAVCPPEAREEPDTNYLAKDYASFRQLILDRLALIMPDWRERHVPDIGIALVEVLAYAGDYLSYYQDAVATEAYLDTARQRISVRRHARLVDYQMHEGCNARAWVCVETDADLTIDPNNIFFITRLDEALISAGTVLSEENLRQIPESSYEVFEPIVNKNEIQEGNPFPQIQLYKDHSRIYFYTWGNKECCLPRGTTSATLKGKLIEDSEPEDLSCDPDSGESDEQGKDNDKRLAKVQHAEDMEDVKDTEKHTHQLQLKPGDVLIFEEMIGPETGHRGDANPKHRHAVRLTSVDASVDRLTNTAVVEISWGKEDALPFPLCLSSLGPAPKCAMIDNVSVACGNVILVDHGKTQNEDLGTVPSKGTVQCCKAEGVLADTTIIPGRYRPYLTFAPLSFSQPPNFDAPAAKMLTQDVRQALPQIELAGTSADSQDSVWKPRRDLIRSGRDDQHFVAELDNEGRAHLRFGDDESGEQPDAGIMFRARYRIGNGLVGNVGAESISHLVLRGTRVSGGSVHVRNPLAALSGTAPEPMSEVKLFAPHLFRKELERAITADDYVAIVQREFKDTVQRAAAKLHWTGSWYEVLVAVDPYGKEEADPKLLDAITKRLHRYRRIGHDLVVKNARRVPLDIEMLVCALPNYLRGHIKAVLLGLLSNRRLTNGALGFFHPDKLSFGDGIYLSQLIATAQAVEGIESIRVTRLHRFGEPANQELENGVLPLRPFEIARLDNDPSLPENGTVVLDVRGGR